MALGMCFVSVLDSRLSTHLYPMPCHLPAFSPIFCIPLYLKEKKEKRTGLEPPHPELTHSGLNFLALIFSVLLFQGHPH